MDNPVNPRREGKMANTASAGPHLERSLVTRSQKFAKGEMHVGKFGQNDCVRLGHTRLRSPSDAMPPQPEPSKSYDHSSDRIPRNSRR
jgi:hypothetical protein